MSQISVVLHLLPIILHPILVHPKTIQNPCPKNSIPTTALHELTGFINHSPEKYILWIVSENSVLKGAVDGEILNLQRIRLLTFFSFNKTYAIYREASFKFRQPFHIMFASFHIDNANGEMWDLLHLYMMKTSTVLILLGYERYTPVSPFDLAVIARRGWLFPCMKVVLDIKGNTQISYKLACAGYCLDEGRRDIPWTEDNLETLLKNPRKRHRTTFRRGNQRDVTVFHNPSIHGYYQPSKYGNDRYACARILLKHRDSIYCDPPLMSIIYMAQVHNLSIRILSVTIPAEKKQFTVHFKSQQIIGILAGFKAFYHIPYIAKFSKSSNYQLCYCEKVDKILYFDVALWTCAFSSESWILLLVTTAVLVISISRLNQYITFSVKECAHALFNVAVIMIGQFPSKLGRLKLLYLTIAFWAMSVSMLYENSITSSVTVRGIPPAYEKIVDILEDGYQIHWSSEGNGSPMEKIGPSLKQKGVTMALNKVFRVVKRIIGSIEIAMLLKNRTARVLSTHQQYHRWHVAKSLIDLSPKEKYKCKEVKEHLGSSHSYWWMYTANRDWLEESIERIHQTGLREKWYYWTIWMAVLGEKLHAVTEEFLNFNKPIPEPDVIVLRKLLPPLALMFGLVSLSVVILAFEIIVASRGSEQIWMEIKSMYSNLKSWKNVCLL